MLSAILAYGCCALTACSSNEDNAGTKDDGCLAQDGYQRLEARDVGFRDKGTNK
jgi:hypothetical protein